MRSVILAAAGDIMCHDANYYPLLNAEGEASYHGCFDEIRPYIREADIAFANLETSFANRPYSPFPNFNAPLSLLETLKDTGFHVFSNANNHVLDMGYEGLCETLDNLDSYGILHTGASRDPEEQQDVVIVEKNEIRVAFLAYTFAVNLGTPVPAGREYCCNIMSRELLMRQIETAKARGADLICASMHWGDEYENFVRGEQTMLAEFMFESGVNIILGSHPHVLQPVRRFGEDRFLAYSLGGLYSGMIKRENARLGCILRLKIEKDGNGRTAISGWDYVPTRLEYDSSQRIVVKDLSVRDGSAAERAGSAAEQGRSAAEQAGSAAELAGSAAGVASAREAIRSVLCRFERPTLQ